MISTQHRQISTALLAVLVLGSGFAGSELSAQQKNERVLKKMTVKRSVKAIAKLAKDGFIPMDADVESNGRRAMLAVRMVKPETPLAWFGKFDLKESKFDSLAEEYEKKKYRLVWHQEYKIKDDVLHACIWHFDENFSQLSEAELKDKEKRPEPKPLGVVWKPGSRISAAGKGIPEFAAFEEQAVAFMRANQMPALSVAVSLKGKMLYQRSFGYSDLKKKKSLKPDQPFRMGSLSRIITVIAALQLVDQGKLKIDQPVYPFLDVKPWKPATVDERAKDITVLHLLQETGGHDESLTIDPTLSPRTITSRMNLKEVVTPKQMVEFMISQPLAYDPGEDTKESAYGYFLLGQVIAKASGKSYEEYVMQNIAKPLKLRSLTMSRTDPDKRTKNEVRHVQRSGHYHAKHGGKNAETWVPLNEGGYKFEMMEATHGWMASPTDLLALSTAIQADPSPILSAKSKVLMIEKPGYLLKKPGGAAKPFWKGCGMFCRKTDGGITFWRYTTVANCSAALFCFSESGLSYCYMSNCLVAAGGGNPGTTFDKILKREAIAVKNKLLR